MSSHQSAFMKSDVWLTPPEILKALGPFDLDPCSPVDRPWDTAARHYTVEDDGLSQPWPADDRIWLNPPYSREAARWMRRLSEHGRGMALIFARTETEMFFETVWRSPTACGLLFLEGRLFFHWPDGSRAANNAGAPSVLIAYGHDDADRLRASGIKGQFIRLKRRPCP